MTPRDPILAYRVLILALLALVVGQALLLGPGLLVQLARGVGQAEPRPQASPVPLTLAQVVEGLGRLEGSPEVLLQRPQAQRLVPVVPLIRQVLDGDASEPFQDLLLSYLTRTLTPAQTAWLQGLAARGELRAAASELPDHLVQLDRRLRLRAGLPPLAATQVSPVRQSLEKMRVRDLVLGLLVLELEVEGRVTPEQAQLLKPMEKLLESAMKRKHGETGQVSVPLVEAQLRALLTDDQQLAIARLADFYAFQSLEVNETALFQNFHNLLVTRAEGDSFSFEMGRVTQAPGNPEERHPEGPAVIGFGQGDLLELPLAVRGIVLQLEKEPTLALSRQQVEEVAVLTPQIQEALNNVMNQVKDQRVPELQARLQSVLTQEQVQYVRAHARDPMGVLVMVDKQEPMARELGRWVEARSTGKPYEPQYDTRSRPVQPDAPPVAAAPEQGTQVPLQTMVRGMLLLMPQELALTPEQVARIRPMADALAGSLENLQAGRMDRRTPSLEKQLRGILTPEQNRFLAEHGEDPVPALVREPGKGPLAREIRRFLAAEGRGYEPQLEPGAIDRPVASTAPAPTRTPGASDAPPLAPTVRVALLIMHGDPGLALTRDQVVRLEPLVPAIGRTMANLDRGVVDRQAPALEEKVRALLTPQQLAFVKAHKDDMTSPLLQRQGEHPLARELERYVRARLDGKPYAPLRDTAGGDPRGGAQAPPPLDAQIRGILLIMEKQPAFRLQAGQVARLRGLAPHLKPALDAIDAGRLDRRQPALESKLREILDERQREFLNAHATDPTPRLQPSADGRSVLSRELDRFLEARAQGRPYEPR